MLFSEGWKGYQEFNNKKNSNKNNNNDNDNKSLNNDDNIIIIVGNITYYKLKLTILVCDVLYCLSNSHAISKKMAREIR